MKLSEHTLAQWIDQWRLAGRELEKERRRRLRSMTPQQARAEIDAVLALASASMVSPERRRTSELIEQQKAFARVRQ